MLRIALERREHVVAANPRHHQIEQDEIELFFPDQIKCTFAVFGGNHCVPLTLQPSGQEIAVRCIVIHYQNTTRLGGRKIRFFRRDRTHCLEQALDHHRRRANLDGGTGRIRRLGAAGKCHQTVNAVEEEGRFFQELVEIGDECNLPFIHCVLTQHFSIPLYRVDWGAQVMAQGPAILRQVRASRMTNGRGIE